MSALRLDHDLLGTHENLLSVRLWNDDQFRENTWILKHMDAKRIEPERSEFATANRRNWKEKRGFLPAT